jgi:TonB family protein
MFSLATVAVVLPPVVENCLAQSLAGVEESQTGVVIAKLSPPVYPLVARLAHITGEVDLMLSIGRDGGVESAVIVSGPPILQRFALESAQKSQFECRRCDEAVTSYSMTYTFQLVDEGCCAAANGPPSDTQRNNQPRPQVIQLLNHVTVIDKVECYCDPRADVRKVRSPKCLYLWKCGYRS